VSDWLTADSDICVYVYDITQGFIQAPFGGGEPPPKPRNFPPRIFGQL